MKKVFPYQLFWKTFWTQLLGHIFVVFFVLGLGYGLLPELSMPKSELKYFFEVWIYKVIPFSLIFIAIFALWFAYKLTMPLASIIQSVRMMGFKKYLLQWTQDESVFEEESGEYYELEVALNRVRKKLRKKYQQLADLREETSTIFAALGDAIVSVDIQQKFVFYNSVFATQFFATEEKRKSNFLSEVIREPEVLSLFNKALETGNVGVELVQLPTAVSKESLYFKIQVAPLKHPDDNSIYGAIGIFYDVTALKKAEKIRIDFISNASHELRTPLTSVKGYMDTLSEDLAQNRTENIVEFVNIVHKNVNRLVDLVNDLFLISKMESSPDLFLEDILPEVITREVVDELKGEYTKKQQEIRIQSEIKNFYADPVKVGQVLRNLLSNAIRYVPEKGIIEVNWQKSNSGINLTIKDNGPGISPTHQARLFERFYRVDKGRSRELGGTGLGLSIVKHIMLAHGGSITVKSQLGYGAEFICYFPQEIGL
jgi:two-component system phosphate regulon sensor histidine kinase PhoR